MEELKCMVFDARSMEDSTSGSPPAGMFNGMSIFPLTETVIDGTSEVWPTFGRPMTVSAVLKKDQQGSFVEVFRIPHLTAEGEKVELFKRFYLHLSQVSLSVIFNFFNFEESNPRI
jgi:hypothetical protein